MNAETKGIQGKHYLMCVDYVTKGTSNRDLAIRYGMSESYITTIKNAPAFKKEEARIREEILSDSKNSLIQYIPDAVKTVVNVMKSQKQVEDNQGNITTVPTYNPPASVLKASEMMLKMTKMIDDGKGNQGAAHVTINMFRPPWAPGEGETIEITTG